MYFLTTYIVRFSLPCVSVRVYVWEVLIPHCSLRHNEIRVCALIGREQPGLSHVAEFFGRSKMGFGVNLRSIAVIYHTTS